MRLSRRRFIQRSSAVAAASVLPIGCSSRSDQSPLDNDRAIIIGSGFAGSVAALRLAEAGIRSLVLERGRKWTVEGTDTFPTTAALDRTRQLDYSSCRQSVGRHGLRRAA